MIPIVIIHMYNKHAPERGAVRQPPLRGQPAGRHLRGHAEVLLYYVSLCMIYTHHYFIISVIKHKPLFAFSLSLFVVPMICLL